MVRFCILSTCALIIGASAGNTVLITNQDQEYGGGGGGPVTNNLLEVTYELSADTGNTAGIRTVDFSLRVRITPGGYFAFGSSESGNMGSSANPSDVFICSENGLTRNSIEGYNQNQFLPGTSAADIGKCDVKKGTASWTQKVKTSVPGQRNLAIGENDMIWAMGTGPEIVYHTRMGSKKIDLTIGAATTPPTPAPATKPSDDPVTTKVPTPATTKPSTPADPVTKAPAPADGKGEGLRNADNSVLSTTLTHDGKDILQLQHQLSVDQTKVDFSVKVLGTPGGYFGVGTSADGSMGSTANPSDVVICSGKGLTRHSVTGNNIVGGEPVPSGKCDVTAGTASWTQEVKASSNGQRDLTVGVNTVIWAMGGGPQIAYHGDKRGSIKIDLTGEADPSEVTLATPASLYVHAICMTLAWAFLIPAAVLTAKIRFGNPNDSRWFSVHQIFNLLGLLLQLAGAITIIVYKADKKTSFKGTGTQKIHYFMGITIVFLGLLQPINAFFRPSGEVPKTSKRKGWEYLHKGVGWILVLAGIANCAIPLSWIEGDFLTVAACVYAAGLTLLFVYGIAMVVFGKVNKQDTIAAEESEESRHRLIAPARRSVNVSPERRSATIRSIDEGSSDQDSRESR